MHKRAVGAVVLLGVVIAATVAILVARQQPVTPEPDNPPAPTTRTLLVQLRDPSLLAMGSVVMGVEESRLDQMWWTADWWIDQIGPQEVSAAELGRKPVSYVMQTVGDQVQVKVDDAWVLDRLAFAGLVDAVGGVRVDVERQTVYLTDDGTPALLPAGVQALAGAQAADYVLDASLQDETLRLQRFQSVWDQVLRRFPTEPEKARTLVVSLGALSKATMPTEELSVLLADAHDLRITGGVCPGTGRTRCGQRGAGPAGAGGADRLRPGSGRHGQEPQFGVRRVPHPGGPGCAGPIGEYPQRGRRDAARATAGPVLAVGVGRADDHACDDGVR